MECCNAHNHNTDHSMCPSCGNDAALPRMSLSRWFAGFAAALLLIYLFAKVL